MTITTTITLNISEANEGLVTAIAKMKGYTGDDVNGFIKEYLQVLFTNTMTDVLIPSINSYFGVAQETFAQTVISQLSTALTTVTVVQ